MRVLCRTAAGQARSWHPQERLPAIPFARSPAQVDVTGCGECLAVLFKLWAALRRQSGIIRRTAFICPICFRSRESRLKKASYTRAAAVVGEFAAERASSPPDCSLRQQFDRLARQMQPASAQAHRQEQRGVLRVQLLRKAPTRARSARDRATDRYAPASTRRVSRPAAAKSNRRWARSRARRTADPPTRPQPVAAGPRPLRRGREIGRPDIVRVRNANQSQSAAAHMPHFEPTRRRRFLADHPFANRFAWRPSAAPRRPSRHQTSSTAISRRDGR
jgi:hypothetical protein